jgi:hypothetical protein
MAKSRVAIGIVTDGFIHHETVNSLIRVTARKAVGHIIINKTGPHMDAGRNEVIRTFYTDPFLEYDRLLFIDSDIEFTPEDVEKLDQDDMPVVSGVYKIPFTDGGPAPVIYEWATADDGRRYMRQDKTLPDEGRFLKVDGVGAGFLMIRRDALDKIGFHYGNPLPWFAEDVIGGVHFGEDLCFCARCEEMEIPVLVDRDVQVAHYKMMRLA